MDDQTPTTPNPDRTPPVAVPDPHAGMPAPESLEGMRPEAAQNSAIRPEQDEPGGPLAGLVGASATQAAAEAVPGADTPTEALPADRDAALLEQMGVEEEGIESGQLLGLVLGVVVGILALGVGLVFLFYLPYRQQVGTRQDNVDQYPELEQSRTEALAKLNNYARADSVYQMPIEQAMSVVTGKYRAGGGTAPTGLPSTRQQWNTLSVNRGLGSAVQNPTGRPQMQSVENRALAAESEGGAGMPIARPQPTAPQDRTNEEVGVDDNMNAPAPTTLGEAQYDG